MVTFAITLKTNTDNREDEAWGVLKALTETGFDVKAVHFASWIDDLSALKGGN